MPIKAINDTTISEAVALLRAGDVVALPTETVYGLGALLNQPKGLEKIFLVKGRPQQDPLILHIADSKTVNDLVEEISEEAKILMKAFWPGPLTLVFKKNKQKVPDLITASLPTVAIRMPKHEKALLLIERAGVPIAAPSANRFQSLSPTTAQAVEEELGAQVPLILDGGACVAGIESTIVSVVGEVELLRQGSVPQEDIELALGHKIRAREGSVSESTAMPAPGLMSFHYAPRTPLKLFNTMEELLREKQSGDLCLVFSNKEAAKFKDAEVLSTMADLSEAARNFFSALRKLDNQKPKRILALCLPDRGLGKAINDRLTKAQHE